MKKSINDSFIYYGLFNSTDDLISYLELEHTGNYYTIVFPNTEYGHRGNGYMTWIYQYAIMHDNLQLISDTEHTEEAKRLWRRIYNTNTCNIVVYNLNTNESHPWNGNNEPWEAQVPYIRLVAYKR